MQLLKGQASALVASRSSAHRSAAVSRKRFNGAKPVVIARTAAAEDAPAADLPGAPMEEEFAFNFSDAKKGNEYSMNDVEAAMAYYAGEGTASEIEAEFVTTPREFTEAGVEDASVFDEFDNNEAYDDEYVAAGIPEAAPKQRRNEREKGEEGGDDNMAAAKQQEELRQAEEQMVLESQLEEMGLDRLSTAEAKTIGPATWEWMQDTAVDVIDEEELRLFARNPTRLSAAVAAALPSEGELLSEMRDINVQGLDLDMKERIDFLLDDFDLELELAAVPEDDEDNEDLPEVLDIDFAEIDAVLAAADAIVVPDLGDLSLSDVAAVSDDGLELDEGVVAKYLAELQAVQGAEMDESEVKNLFDGAPIESVAVADEAPITIDDADLVESSQEMAAIELPAGLMDMGDEDLADVEDSLKEYAPDWLWLTRMSLEASFEVPSPEDLELLGKYLDAGEVYIAQEDARKESLAQAVIAGDLSADALDEAVEDTVDTEADLLAGIVDEEEDDEVYAAEEEEQWQERIIELNRVTKVVKGGKLMGFRCVAIVGNGAGLVGVGCQSGREVATAVKRALVDAKKSVVRVPLVGAGTIPHRSEAKFHAARCVVVPAADGTGCLAGGSIRSVLELAGVKDVLGKRIGCRSALNNARACVKALEQLRTLNECAEMRGVPMERLLLPQ